ncbi:Nucleoid-associated protein CF0672 [Dissostichus eleginoides]|uniref:Nucleoid-associated protein CF0672 n=1 Tax=Dissostichus eleginoides TaxID=100907 RepID=A0AAD9BLR4_DISEL|nr:Nucleoid-associated protein CF0672 [Dissostichus eleginoides]
MLQKSCSVMRKASDQEMLQKSCCGPEKKHLIRRCSRSRAAAMKTTPDQEMLQKSCSVMRKASDQESCFSFRCSRSRAAAMKTTPDQEMLQKSCCGHEKIT